MAAVNIIIIAIIIVIILTNTRQQTMRRDGHVCVCLWVCVCVWVCSPWVAGFRFRRLVEMEEEIRELTGEGGAASCSSPKTKCQTSPFCSEVQVLRPLSPLKPRAQEPATGNAVDFVCKHVYEGQPEPVRC